jgi:hypothetical protein
MTLLSDLEREHESDLRKLLEDHAARLRAALTKISAIRDSIVGMQGFNFSEHAYPLVAALGEAGFDGAGYEIARVNLGTLIEQRDRVVAERDQLRGEVKRMRPVFDAALAWNANERALFSCELPEGSTHLTRLRQGEWQTVNALRAAVDAARDGEG